MNELSERLARLKPLQEKKRIEFDIDPLLRDIVERNLEIAAQCCIDISHRIIVMEGAKKARGYYEAILRLGELGVLTPEFAQRLAPIAGFRNVLAHEYLDVDWDIVFHYLHTLDDLVTFHDVIRAWYRDRLTQLEG